MTLNQKLEKLNKLCESSLGITRYGDEWTCNSYHDGSALYSLPGGQISGNTLDEMADKALDYIKENSDLVVIKGKKYRLIPEE